MTASPQAWLFRAATGAALAGWIVLAAFPGWSDGPAVVRSVAIALLAGLYGVALVAALRSPVPRGGARPGFFTLDGVLALFASPRAVLAAWIHILAFDLFVGVYIRQEGEAAGIGHAWLLPCYALTMMFGPLGWLLFVAVRAWT